MFKITIIVYLFTLIIVKCSENEVTTEIVTSTQYITTEYVDGAINYENVLSVNNNLYSGYIDNIISAIKEQQWIKDEEECVDETLLMMKSLQNSTFWAVWKWDAMTTNPNGVLFGTRYQLGNFDQCLSTPWPTNNTVFRSQYCLADVILEGNKIRKPMVELLEKVDPYEPVKNVLNTHRKHGHRLDVVSYGVCVPSSCSPKSVKKLVTALVKGSYVDILNMPITIHVGDFCQTSASKEYDGAFYAFITLAIILVAITLICTYLSRKKRSDISIGMRLIRAFCIETNSKNLLTMKSGGLNVLYGIRFLTICLIVLGHEVGMYNGGPTTNIRNIEENILTGWNRIYLHFDIFVDTFYMMSGLLTASNFLHMENAPKSVIIIVIKRYVRLVAALAVMVFYMSAVFSYTGSGPLWPLLVNAEEGPCKRNWWLNLLMINNYVNTQDICIVISWYIPTDFQFFIVAVVLYCVYRKCKPLAMTAATVLAVASAVATGLVTYVNDLAPIQPLTHEFLLNQRDNKEFNLTYIKAHTRFAAYYVGLAAGYMINKLLRDNNRKDWPVKWSFIGAITGLCIMLVAMFFGAHLLSEEVTPIESALYAASNRPAWTIGLAIFITCCSLGRVPLITPLLSWYPWVPLSRLSYGLYLTHSFIILRNVFISRQPQHSDWTHILMEASGALVWGIVAAFVIWILVEAPISNLLIIGVSPRPKQNDPERDNSQSKSTIHDRSGHLRDNFPSCIQISKI